MKRRDFLKLAAAGATGLALPSCNSKWFNLFGDGDEEFWGLNVHPYSGSLYTLQLAALRELNIQKIRITLGLGRDLAGPYLSGYQAEYLGIISDFDNWRVNVSTWSANVRDAVNRSAGISYYQVLNEPGLFHNISASEYVNSYLRPAYNIIRELRPGVPVVAAAAPSTSAGLFYFLQMSEAGADSYCDYRAVHAYGGGGPELYLSGTDRPFIVTETGTGNRSRHLSWWTDEMSSISRILDTDRLYFYVLLDQPDGGKSLISGTPDAQGNPQPVSTLYNYIKDL
jgi:hypothetical protein